jgi:release factor-specific protein-(glutamine-N5) methyltransferase
MENVIAAKDVLSDLRKRLSEAGIEEAVAESYLFLEWICGIDKASFFADPDAGVPTDKVKRLWEMVDKRTQRVPLQYLMESCEFMGCPFYVDKRVLIPRQDTEILAEKVINILKQSDIPYPDILDMCTGSGALGISIAANVPNAYVTMSDSSKEALNTAMNNASINKVNKRCIFLLGDMFDALPEDKRFDLIVCNPPYIESAVIDTLATEVKDHEPRIALDGGPDGLAYYRIIAYYASEHLRSGGILALEIGSNQAGSVKRLLMKAGTYKNIRKYKDLAGLDRVLIAERI